LLQRWRALQNTVESAYAALIARALLAAVEAHAFCWLYCIHGDQMAFADDICSSRISR